MSLFADFKMELEGRRCIERDWGFVTYDINGDSAYIEDIYIKPEMRRQKLGSSLADMVVEEVLKQDCKFLFGSVIPTKGGSTESLKALLGYGFRIHSAKDNFILLVKELK